MTTDLPANLWSPVTSDNAGQPCIADNLPSGSCDRTSDWAYIIRGHNTYMNLRGAKAIEQRIYVTGGSGGCYVANGGADISCYGTYDPATAYHFLIEDTVIELDAYSTQIDFHAAEWILAPTIFGSPDPGAPANYQAFWVFARPMGGAAKCVGTFYDTEEHLTVAP